MQAKKRLKFTRPVCCVSVVLNAFVNSADMLKHNILCPDDEQNHLMLHEYILEINCLNLIY